MLLDALQKPEADLGLELGSLLEWRQVDEGRVDHLVLGRGQPGGIWQVSRGLAGVARASTFSLLIRGCVSPSLGAIL